MNLKIKDRKLLEIEYKELCQDWRTRDKYVLDKLGAAGILFALLGLAIATIPEQKYLIRWLLALMGTFFSLTLSVSVFKDIYYRNNTEKMLKHLSKHLGITKSLQNLKYDDLTFEFGRKIHTKELKDTSLNSLKIPNFLKNFLRNRATFNWIFYFYLISFIIFLILLVAISWDWIYAVLDP